MGWMVEYDFRPRKEFIRRLVKPWESQDWTDSGGAKGHKSQCLKHVYRGAPHKGVLYALWQNTYADGSVVKFAVVYLVQLCRPDGWGYKDMEASCGPNYYAFPLSWLEGIDDSGYAKEWIAHVKEYWEDQKRKRAEKREARKAWLRSYDLAGAHSKAVAGDRELQRAGDSGKAAADPGQPVGRSRR